MFQHLHLRWWLLAALLLIVGAGFLAARSSSSAVIFDVESEFGRVRVVERVDGLRSLYTGDGRARQSAIFPGRPRHLEIPYTRTGMVGLALIPPDARVLFVGLGGGAMPMFAREVLPALRIDVVEIDPLIVDVARRFFGFTTDPKLLVHVGDGRPWIEATPPGSYDLIVLDAFSDDAIPAALTTREFLEAAKAALADGGIVLSNLWASQREFDAMVATYRAVFEQVHLVRVGDGVQRILVAGGPGRKLDRSELAGASERLNQRVALGFDLANLVRRGYEEEARRQGRILEDARLEPGR
jgi:spermidine synthase